MKQFQTKLCEFKVEEAGVESDEKIGTIRGYASTFGNIDQGDDVVDKGAFKQTIKQNKGKFPILDSHMTHKQIGWNVRAEEDDRGLKVEGEVYLNNPDAIRLYTLAQKAVQHQTKMGLSIGFSTVKAVPDNERPRVRRLKEVRLWEYSIVSFPMNTEASVEGFKGLRGQLSKMEFLNELQAQASRLGIKMSDIADWALRNGAAAVEDESGDHSSFASKIDAAIAEIKQNRS